MALAPLILLALQPSAQQEPTGPQVRAFLNEACTKTPGAIVDVAEVRNTTIPLEDRTLKVRIYTPTGKRAFATLLYLHGGGFVGGNLDTHDRLCRVLARRSGAMVYALDYRLAPETPFPGPVEDAEAALRWIARSARRFGSDPSRLAVAGDSGGANLAAVLAQWAARNGPKLRLQVLVNPALDASRYNTPGYEEYALFRKFYAPKPEEWKNPRLSPLWAKSVAGVAPACVIAGETDPLLAETREYVGRLKKAKVPVTFWLQPKQGHLGPLFAANAPAAQEPIRRVTAALKQALAFRR